MLSSDSLNLVKNVYAELTSGDFESFKELVTDNKNQYFKDGANLCKALLIESERGSLELNYLSHELHTNTQGFYAPCYIIANNGELYNLKQKAGYEPVISKIKDSLKGAFCEAANLDEKLTELLTNTKPVPRLEFVKVSEGYDLEGLPHSCQSGKGYRFECLNNMAKMALLRIGSRIAARCIVWNEGIIYDETKGEYLTNRRADRLYYGDSNDRDLFISALENEGINLLWGVTNSRLRPDTAEFYIKAPKDLSCISWLDTFSLLKDDYLYSYDWVNGGYSVDTLDELAKEYGFTRAFLNVDLEGGEELEADNSNMVYSEWAGYSINRDNAVYSEALADYLPEDDAVWSEFLGDYILADSALYSVIERDYIDERTLEHSPQIATDIDTNQWVTTANPDYVPYMGNEFKRIHLDNAVYIARDDEYIHVDDAIYIDELDEYVPTAWDARDLKDRLADCLSDLTNDELDALVEKYGF